MRFNLINPKHYYREFTQLAQFVISPKYDVNRTLTVHQKIEGTWTMFIVKTILAIIVGVLIGLFYDPNNKTTASMAERFSPAVLLFISVLAFPLLEEIAYRLSLKFKPVYLALTLGVIAYYISSKALYHTKLSDVHDHFLERIIFASTTLSMAFPLFSVPKVKQRLETFWLANFRWIFYFFSLTFAWVHILNYELTLEHILLMPIITLPKLMSAMCYGYVRVQYGFIYCVAIHIINNSIGFIARLI